MNYVTTKEVAAKWGISERRVLQYCVAGRIVDAEKMGNTCLFPNIQKSLWTNGEKNEYKVGAFMAMWNPWRGCHRYSEGCKYCYIHKGDDKRT